MSFLAIMAITAAITSAGVQAYGQYQQGKAAESQAKSQQAILEYNARQQQEQAEAEREAARLEAEKFKKEGQRLLGTQQVSYAKGGVLTTEGTPWEVMTQTEAELKADEIEIRKQGFLKARYLESQAHGMRLEGQAVRRKGKNIRRGSTLAAGGTLLTGFGIAGYMGATI
jgi:hypothetical protein